MGNCSRSKVKDPVYSKVPSMNIASHSAPVTSQSRKESSKLERQPSDRTPKKSPKDHSFLKSILESHFLFSRLCSEDLEKVIEAMTQETFNPKQLVFSQGDQGNNFYIVKDGKMELVINKKRKGFLETGEAFGELALLHDSKRTATVRSLQNSTLWCIDRTTFRNAIQTINEAKYTENKNFIENVPLFQLLTAGQVQGLLTLLVSQKFTDGQKIVVEGDPGDIFYIIKEGKVKCTAKGLEIRKMGKGEFFGEQALLYNTVRTATVSAIGAVQVLSLGREQLVTVLGSHLQQILYKNSLKIAFERDSTLGILDSQQIEQVINSMKIKSYSEGEVVIPKGNHRSLWVVLKGSLNCGSQQKSVFECIGSSLITRSSKLNNSKIQTNSNSVNVSSVQKIHKFSKSLRQNSQTSPNSKRSGAIQKSISQKDQSPEKSPKTKKPPKSNSQKPKSSEITGRFVASEACDVAQISIEKLEETLGDSFANVAGRNEVLRVLKTVHLFRTLPMGIIRKLASALRIEQFAPNEIVFKKDDPGNAFYVVKSGYVHIEVDGVFIRTIGKHDFFGERSIMLNENRTATVTAKDHTELWVLNREDFMSLLEERTHAHLFKRIQLQDDKVTLRELQCVKVLGKGMFGTVMLTYRKARDFYYALKTVMRAKVHAFDIYENLILEREILLQLDHPLILKLVKTFKDTKRLYFLMEYVRGMDLFDVIRQLNLLSNSDCKFYMGCLLLMIEHLHERNIIYRDLKPENIMVDESGYPKLIDFGAAKVLNNRTYTVVGTPHYMAPEIIIGKGYSLAADYWSIGIILYEFISGCVPFGEEEEDTYRIYEIILENNLEYPECVNKKNKARPLIERLLNKNPTLRGTYSTIKQDDWFYNLSWEKLLAKQVKPPYVPEIVEEDLQPSKRELFEMIDFEEMKDLADIPDFTHKPPPKGWDDEF